MTQHSLSAEFKKKLIKFLNTSKGCDLVTTYLFYLEDHYKLHPVLFPQGKTIYRSVEEAVEKLEQANRLWHVTELRVAFHEDSVNEETKRVYICPFSGKAFGDNTHANPQDAIYDWVSQCPENNEWVNGLKVKRFYVSEDPEVIKKFIVPHEKPVTKRVFSSVITGKLFHSKEAIIDDFVKHYVKPTSLPATQTQDRFDLEESFLQFIQEEVTEENLATFIEGLSEDPTFEPYIHQWIEPEEA